MKNMNYAEYQSPFSWRYGSDGMRQNWSEENKYKTWRKVWVNLAKAQSKYGLVSKKELADLEKNQNNIDIERILEIEDQTKHDVVAAIKEFAQKAKIGGRKIHLGATSMDINDNAEMLRIKEALEIIKKELLKLLQLFARKVEKYADFVCMGYTHLQPAEPTTLGYRFAFYAQDLLMDLGFLGFVRKNLKGKGMKGAVGTSDSYVSLLGKQKAEKMELEVLEELGINAFDIANQTYPRKLDFLVGSLLSSIAQSLYKFAIDVRIMQSPMIGEWQEPFGKSQVGSSAMPFKKNPIKSEQICSLARLVVNLSRTTWDNAAHMILERTLDDSANRRVVIPEMFLAIDEILATASKVIDGLIINEKQISNNLEKYWPFSATEAIIIETVKNGADRQEMHEALRKISMKAWEEIQSGGENPMETLLRENKEIGKYLNADDIKKLLDASGHIGNAKEKSLTMSRLIDKLN